jgi:hypothetical protein
MFFDGEAKSEEAINTQKECFTEHIRMMRVKILNGLFWIWIIR